MPILLHVSIYNSAGELVKTVFEGMAQEIPKQVKLSTPALAAGQGTATLQLPGLLFNGQDVAWDGTNNNGQFVSGGEYYWKVESKDSYGHVSTLIQPMSVVNVMPLNSLEIFNSAGEVVADIPLQGYAGGVTDFSLEESRFAAAYDPSTGAPLSRLKVTLKDASGASHDFFWDGRNSQGRPLDSGNYMVRLISQGQGQATLASLPLTVVRAAQAAAFEKASLAPNPAPADVRRLTLEFGAGTAGRIHLRLYNLAGEAVARADGDAGPGRLDMDVSALSTGVYFAVAECWDLGAMKGRRVFNMAVIH
jgi:hypothetical protein